MPKISVVDMSGKQVGDMELSDSDLGLLLTKPFYMML
jgi:hypothetical protein